MQRILLAALLVVTLAACGANRSPVSESASLPLQASIVAPIERGGFLLSINRPAHVALFEIVPQRGASLIYPTFGEEQPTAMGSIFALPGLVIPGRWVYAPTLPWGGVNRPRFILMIASKEPIPAEALRQPGAIRRLLGYRKYTALNPYDVMDELAAAVVPDQPDEAWSVDVLVDWGSVVPPQLAYRLLQCADGRTLAVPRQYASLGLGCPGDAIRSRAVAATSWTQPPSPTRRTTPGAPGGTTGRVAEAARPGGGTDPSAARTVEREASRPAAGGRRINEGGEGKKP